VKVLLWKGGDAMVVRKFEIGKHERGLLFRKREFECVLGPGRHWLFDPLRHVRVAVTSIREPWIAHPKLDVLVRSGLLGDEIRVIDLGDRQRALVWVDGRFGRILGPGLHAVWTVFCDVRVEILDVDEPRFEHSDLRTILSIEKVGGRLALHVVEPGHVGIEIRDGRVAGTLEPGIHAFWRDVGTTRVVAVDCREVMADVAGQELMTADKVTLRVNAMVTYRVKDPLLAVGEVEDFRQTLYRATQLALRATVGGRELDALLMEKDAVAAELVGLVRSRAAAFGVEVVSVGIRDVILPGDMKILMNRVIEARKAAEAALVTRREETAAMRSQANTARLLADNPTLMRLRELEVLESIAGHGKLEVVLGEKGLADRVVNLI
jgi:regulator of protease activity HflC (stomatin/prohibitin superfamily)